MEEKKDNSVLAIRSNQNLSCNWTGTADFGRLVPFHWEELLKGDKIVRCRPDIELQMLSIASPTFGKLDLYCHYFFVPLRLIWEDAYDVLTQTGAHKNAVPPQMTRTQLRAMYRESLQLARPLYKHWTSLGLPAFFALPDSITITDKPVSLLPFRAYRQIWWDFYRDPELIRDESKSQYIDASSGFKTEQGYHMFLTPNLRSITNSWIADLFADAGTISPNVDETCNPFGSSEYRYPDDGANVSSELQFEQYVLSDDGTSTPSSTRMIRLCETLTRLSERLSLSGKRQIDAFMARYGAKPDWLRMNMCQYLGGAKSTVAIADITAASDTVQTVDGEVVSGSPLGAKAASGYSRFSDLNITFEAEEPGYLMGIFSVVPHVHFVQGFDKRWTRGCLTDFFQKSLEHVGNVAVQKEEVAFSYGGSPNQNKVYTFSQDNDVFAFRDPYYEYKVGRDILAGDFMYYHHDYSEDEHGNISSSLAYMHSMELYVDYDVLRTYNAQSMVIDGSPFNKLFYYLGGSVWDDVDDHFQLCIDKDVLINRPMDGFAIPTLETTENPHAGKANLPSDSVI